MVEVQHQPRASAGIDQAEIIATLRVTKRKAPARGSPRGVVARGEDKGLSDIDILIELDAQAPVGSGTRPVAAPRRDRCQNRRKSGSGARPLPQGRL
jgi:hypothetical protein